MEYCYYVWAGSPSCYLEMLDRLQKLVGRPIAASLESQPSLVFYLGSFELADLAALLYSSGWSIGYSIAWLF